MTTSPEMSAPLPGRPHNRVYRSIFRDHYGSPPYDCHFCDQEMETLEHVHHLDEDPWNNVPSNLAAAHAFCHNSVHHAGTEHSEETRQRIIQTLRSNLAALTDDERRAKYGQPGERNPFFGKTHSAETREKLRQYALGRPGPKTVHTDETKRHLSLTIKNLPRKWCDECARDWPPGIWSRHVRKYHEGGKW